MYGMYGERVKLSFGVPVGGKVGDILPASRENKMRRVVFCPPGFIPKKGMSYWAEIFPIYRKGCQDSPVTFVYEGEMLHIYNCQLEDEAGFSEVFDATRTTTDGSKSAMALALQAAQEKSGKEIPIAGRLKIGQKVTLEVNCRIDSWTGNPSFCPEYLNFGDPLIGGDKSMRIYHVKGKQSLASGQKWNCEVQSISPSLTKNSKGYKIIHIQVTLIAQS